MTIAEARDATERVLLVQAKIPWLAPGIHRKDTMKLLRIQCNLFRAYSFLYHLVNEKK